MSTLKKRTYNSEGRLAKAQETKSRILVSSQKLFEKEGFENVTIEKIAEDAQVSIPTIYSLYKSKKGILLAILDSALPIDRHIALLEEVKSEMSPKDRVAMGPKIARQMYDAEKKQMDMFRGALVLSPEFKELEKEREERRYKRQEETVKRLAKEKALKKGLTVSKARDILWAFTGRDMYRMLVVERGWTSDEYEKWITQMLVLALIGPD